MYAYSNNGLACRAWNNPAALQPGEVYFTQVPTSAQLAAAFPGYAAAAAAQAGQAAYNAAIAAGCAIVSTGTPGLSGTYGISPQDEINITSLQTGIAAGAPWLGYYRDASGAQHTMTAPQFTAIATAILGYVEALEAALATALAGGAWAAPATPVTIA